MSGMPEMKPCPFCSGDDTYITEDARDMGYIGCNDCHARGPCVELIGPKGFTASGFAWNTRADATPTVAEAMRCPEVAALVDALRRIEDLTQHDMGMTAADETCVNREARAALAPFTSE